MRTSIAVCVLAVITLLAPVRFFGQCQDLGGAAKPQVPEVRRSAPEKQSTGQPEFFDEPQFTVAGVADTTNLGGHGSDTIVRTKEALAKETASLSKETAGSSRPGSSALNAATEKSLREAAERNTEDFAANYRLGKLLVGGGKAREAIPYLERASQLNTVDYASAYELARAYADADEYEKARNKARALLTFQDKSVPGGAVPENASQDHVRQDSSEVHHLLGDVEEKLGNPLEAVREYQRAAELNPSEPTLFDWGAELLMHRAPEPAIQVFTKGNHLFPYSVRMLTGLGVAWYVRGSYDPAAERLCEASDLNPSDPTPYLFLGKMLSVGTTQSDGLKERLERFVRRQPENALANYYYAMSLSKQWKGPEDSRNFAQVESLLEKAVHLDPKLGLGYLQLGILYSDRKDLSRAISAYQKAIEASPGLEEAHYRLAQVYRRTGERSKAQAEIRLYDQLTKKTMDEIERERHEIQQFVYTLRDPRSDGRPN